MYQKIAFLLVGILAVGIAAGYATTKQHNKKVSCYYSSWAFYRNGYGKFDVEDINTELCTHGFYGFADLSNITWEIYAYDPWFDLGEQDCDPGYCNYDGYRRFVALGDRNPNFYPMLSIGGWNAGSGKYSYMALDAEKRRTFIDSTMALITKYRFAGVDLDWEYPGNRIGANATVDKESFSILVDEFSQVLKPAGKLFTTALGCGYDKILIAYDIPYISERFDFMNIMGYDFNGAWNNYTGHNAPIFYTPEEHYEGHPSYRYNLYDTVELFLQLGLPASKMVLGMPTYGRGVHLMDPDLSGLFCPADGGFPMGPYTRQSGHFGYLEVLQLFNNDTLNYFPDAEPKAWNIVVDDCYMSPYTHNGPYWTSYDDPESISYKVQYANWHEMAGVMIWSIETDDFKGFYSDVDYPILRRMNEELVLGKKYNPKKIPCGSAPMCPDYIRTTPAPSSTTQSTTSTTTTSTTTKSTTTTPTTATPPSTDLCQHNGETFPYPGNCHKYYVCIQVSSNPPNYRLEVFDCGPWVFNPVANECVDPNETANENICGENGF